MTDFELVIKGEERLALRQAASSCNASQLPPFLVTYLLTYLLRVYVMTDEDGFLTTEDKCVKQPISAAVLSIVTTIIDATVARKKQL